ncbi:ferric enterobactin transport system, ATP-binding protein [Renibacterium salmoninarum ATCC 33209]|uniref:Ferric enterobactin transport system, ATP-binding protein n=1 Tax=Renibacterium salmoninarum (strain ATCC 33209 / DSM 20767 / JCM 11484 / NBRC 15589 / NCIMB 2235) TaxID=288705 RepID=A9WMV6_RENSM|nr:ABC transporter ATP-binding protein [Renibacterium salmoninarum]ABY23417.1 ferric enterobactin transport system, ATP-binding protein [Renibacterium salmoninarum ATCC 33209]
MKNGSVQSAALRAEGVSLGYDRKQVVSNLSLEIAPGAVTAIIGPNGCGKSTLLRGLGRLLKPSTGQVYLDDKPIGSISTRQVATRLSILPQTPAAPSGLTVADLVARGRHPRQHWYQQFSKTDESAVYEALAATDIADLADVPIEELSGGQRQRAWISMVLAQESEILLLDEPTTYLDLAHQVEVLQLVERLNRELGRTILMVLHDISLAARYSDHMVAMKEGAIVASGTPQDVVTEPQLLEIFGLEASVVAEPVAGRPHVIPLAAR